jgi:hypothetical protein
MRTLLYSTGYNLHCMEICEKKNTFINLRLEVLRGGQKGILLYKSVLEKTQVGIRAHLVGYRMNSMGPNPHHLLHFSVAEP